MSVRTALIILFICFLGVTGVLVYLYNNREMLNHNISNNLSEKNQVSGTKETVVPEIENATSTDSWEAQKTERVKAASEMMAEMASTTDQEAWIREKDQRVKAASEMMVEMTTTTDQVAWIREKDQRVNAASQMMQDLINKK